MSFKFSVPTADAVDPGSSIMRAKQASAWLDTLANEQPVESARTHPGRDRLQRCDAPPEPRVHELHELVRFQAPSAQQFSFSQSKSPQPKK